MSVLKREAEALRASAARLEAAANDAPRTAKDLIRRFAPVDCIFKYQQRIELELANEPIFVEHAVKCAGVALGVEIGKKLRAMFKGVRMPDPFNPFCQLGSRGVTEYEAEVVVLSRPELEALVEKALRAGRESA